MTGYYNDFIYTLQMLCMFRDVGIYNAATSEIDEITEDDYFELAERGIECSAPIFIRDDVPMGGDEYEIKDTDLNEEIDHYHTLYRVSSPEMKEYYRLCRLIEYRGGIQPEDNPYVKEADKHYCDCLKMIYTNLWAGFDSNRHTTELVFELCPDYETDVITLIMVIIDTLKYYPAHLGELERDLRMGKPVFLPELPEHIEITEASDETGI
jgi:hypothetical protein